ncbi:hypothetical protein DCAR_0833050 [Daucus carota subsp. sativus]|uniref:Homeobox-leucine zipper protein n=1 Tax=Daucus carota subsp. sativus TaxID=79200 RepID=A0A175YSS4_DAUCS|nr:PREDICTED: homeobox-leucine zipper protein HOX20-like [Daucus carota subsp. sativus]WOH13540.1 hypothetical protein DCAR_0833050 [Daucus carota subsp. sativus]
MGISSTFDGSDTTLLLKSGNLNCPSGVLESFWMSNSSPSFQDCPSKVSASIVDFQNPPQDDGRKGRLFSSLDVDEDNGEAFDPSFHRSEKKRRLSKDQVQFLEKSFEKDNKLEPDRKVQLAKEIGLQPRQVAIWYQNRRARCKSKQLEKDYDVLKESYDKLKVDYENLLKENESLRIEVESMKDKMPVSEKREVNLEPVNARDVGAKPTEDLIVQNENTPQLMIRKPEYVNSSESPAVDSDSLYSVDGNLKSVFESVDSSSVFEPDYSDFSQDGEEGFSRMLLLPDLPMLETECFDDMYVDHSNLAESSVGDQHLLLWTNVFDV